MIRYNNWMAYTYNGQLYDKKIKSTDKIKFQFSTNIKKPLPCYKDSLIQNAKKMRDSFSEPFDVCLSGGIDSEVMVRIFKEVGIKHNTFIFKLENDYNIRDVNSALIICKELDLKHKVIDFNLEKFFFNDAEKLFSETLIPYAGRLPRLKFIEYLENIPVFGEGEPTWKRELGIDYTKKSNWHFILTEDQNSLSIFGNIINRKIIGEWYKFTPEVFLSFIEIPYVQKLLNDEIIGKQSVTSSKLYINKLMYPQIKDKIKLVGYEGLYGEQGSRPEFMTEFYNKYMKNIENTTYKYTQQEINSLFLQNEN